MRGFIFDGCDGCCGCDCVATTALTVLCVGGGWFVVRADGVCSGNRFWILRDGLAFFFFLCLLVLCLWLVSVVVVVVVGKLVGGGDNDRLDPFSHEESSLNNCS